MMASGILIVSMRLHVRQLMNTESTAHFPTQHLGMTQIIPQAVRYVSVQLDLKSIKYIVYIQHFGLCILNHTFPASFVIVFAALFHSFLL